MKNDNIPSIVSTLYKIKAECPYLRIGQIIDDFNYFCNTFGLQPYYLTDKDYAEQLEKYYDCLKGNKK